MSAKLETPSLFKNVLAQPCSQGSLPPVPAERERERERDPGCVWSRVSQGSTLTFQLTSLAASDKLDVTSQKNFLLAKC